MTTQARWHHHEILSETPDGWPPDLVLEPDSQSDFGDQLDQTLATIALDPRYSPAAYLRLALDRMSTHEWPEAATFANESLVHNSANPIAWWVKHFCVRKMGQEDEDALLNAHYLAPHEPLLKADAYLRNPDGGEKLLDTYGDDPQPFREVAEVLAMAGLFEELHLWLGEAMKRANDPMFEVLLAWAYEKAGKGVEAETLITRVRECGNRADPLRPVERRAAAQCGVWDRPL